MRAFALHEVAMSHGVAIQTSLLCVEKINAWVTMCEYYIMYVIRDIERRSMYTRIHQIYFRQSITKISPSQNALKRITEPDLLSLFAFLFMMCVWAKALIIVGLYV